MLQVTTTMTQPSRSIWNCRKEGPLALGPTLELCTTLGKQLYMRVAVATVDVAGELNHVIRMSRCGGNTSSQ
jgi:hypothetical protein